MKQTSIIKKAGIGLALALGMTMSFSCAKKAQGIRTVKQTRAQFIDSYITSNSMNAASAQGALFNISVIELPTETDSNGSITVKSEIKSPNGQYIPISTTHTNGSDAYGVYTDSPSGITLDIRARCIGSTCDKYVLMITEIKMQRAVHQMIAISNKSQDYFNLKHINYAVSAQFYQSLDQAQNIGY